MTPIEIIALVVIIAGIMKFLVLIFNPGSWMNFSKRIWANSSMSIVSFVLGAIVLYYLLQEITIVQILATTAFVALLMAIGLGKYANDLIMIYETKIKKEGANVLKDNWLIALVWIILMLWGLKELFM